MNTSRVLAVIVAVSVFAASGAAAAPAGSLELKASLPVVSTLGAQCPSGLSPSAICAARTASGQIRGLGSVRVAYTWGVDVGSLTCEPGRARVLGYPVTIGVPGKGDLSISVAEGRQCVDQDAVRNESQSFTVVGGTGTYAGASGGGTVERLLGQTASGAAGRESWIGTLTVPEVVFDVVPPVLTGIAGKSVRVQSAAKRARVRYLVSARDAIDGVVAAVCRPRSGAWFPLGRTLVRCSAIDSSGNEAAGSFAVLVRRSR